MYPLPGQAARKEWSWYRQVAGCERPVLKGAQSRPKERVGAGGPANGSGRSEDADAGRPSKTREWMPSVPNGRPGGRFDGDGQGG
jgi:hypothetical protein